MLSSCVKIGQESAQGGVQSHETRGLMEDSAMPLLYSHSEPCLRSRLARLSSLRMSSNLHTTKALSYMRSRRRGTASSRSVGRRKAPVPRPRFSLAGSLVHHAEPFVY